MFIITSNHRITFILAPLPLLHHSTFGTEQIQHLWSDFHALAAFLLEVQPSLDPDDGLKHVSFHAVSLLRLDACHVRKDALNYCI